LLLGHSVRNSNVHPVDETHQHAINDLGHSVLVSMLMQSGAICKHFSNHFCLLVPNTNSASFWISSLEDLAVFNEAFILKDKTNVQGCLISLQVIPFININAYKKNFMKSIFRREHGVLRRL
jgi:hypothetical protein